MPASAASCILVSRVKFSWACRLKFSLPSNTWYTYLSVLTLKGDVGFTDMVLVLDKPPYREEIHIRNSGDILDPSYEWLFSQGIYGVWSEVSADPCIAASRKISRSPFISVRQYIMAYCNISRSLFMSIRQHIVASYHIPRSPFISVRQYIMASGNISQSSFVSVYQS